MLKSTIKFTKRCKFIKCHYSNRIFNYNYKKCYLNAFNNFNLLNNKFSTDINDNLENIEKMQNMENLNNINNIENIKNIKNLENLENDKEKEITISNINECNSLKQANDIIEINNSNIKFSDLPFIIESVNNIIINTKVTEDDIINFESFINSYEFDIENIDTNEELDVLLRLIDNYNDTDMFKVLFDDVYVYFILFSIKYLNYHMMKQLNYYFYIVKMIIQLKKMKWKN